MKLLEDLVKQGMSDVASVIFKKVVSDGINNTNKFLKEKTGLDIKIDNPLQPEHIHKMKSLKEIKIDNDRAIDDYKHLVNMHKLEVEDRKDARKAYIAKINKNDMRELFLPLLSVLIYVVCFSGLLLLVTTPNIDEKLVPTISATLTIIVLTVAHFWFGSSKASKDLDGREG